MTQSILVAPLVGDHFRPPAKLILAVLPAGASLILEPEPENAYDESAVRVLVDVEEIPETQFGKLEEELPLMGFTLEQVMSTGPVWLGYVAKSGGKPIAQAQALDPSTPLVGNQEIGEALLDAGHQASLGFGPDGKARVIVSFEDQASGGGLI